MIVTSLCFQATAPGSSGAAASASTGDSATLLPSRPVLLAVLSYTQAAGWIQITTPSGHDTTRGWRVPTIASGGGILATPESAPVFRPQETVSVTIAGSATAGDIESAVLMLAYPEIPGGKFVGYSEITSRARRTTTIYAALTGSTSGGYSGEELLTAESDLLRADTQYAVLGALVSSKSNVTCLTLRGPDTANYRVPIPALTLADYGTRAPMLALADRSGLDTIPVINSGNRYSTYIGLVGNENAATPNIALLLAEL